MATSIWKNKHLLALWLCATSGFAAENPRSFFFAGKSVPFIDVPERRLLISKSCLDLKGQLVCQAWQALQSAKIPSKRASAKPGFSENPVVPVCLDSGGEPETGIDSKENENSFCRFKDGS
jgi:hypothetical protein